MPRRFRIVFDHAGLPASIHRVRNFGEALFLMARNRKTIICSLDEIDRATNTIFLTVRSANKARRVVAEVEKLLSTHGFEGHAKILADELS